MPISPYLGQFESRKKVLRISIQQSNANKNNEDSAQWFERISCKTEKINEDVGKSSPIPLLVEMETITNIVEVCQRIENRFTMWPRRPKSGNRIRFWTIQYQQNHKKNAYETESLALPCFTSHSVCFNYLFSESLFQPLESLTHIIWPVYGSHKPTGCNTKQIKIMHENKHEAKILVKSAAGTIPSRVTRVHK